MKSSETGGPMLPRATIAANVLQCALQHEPESRLLGNVRACEIAALAASAITTCPVCGAEAWVNIDCDYCLCAGALARGEVP